MITADHCARSVPTLGRPPSLPVVRLPLVTSDMYQLYNPGANPGILISAPELVSDSNVQFHTFTLTQMWFHIKKNDITKEILLWNN